MLVIGILLIILTSLNCEELQCAKGELKNNGQLVETNTEPLQQGLFCGWQLEAEPSCKSVIITAKYVKRNEKRKCELMDDNISFNCYCEGDLCNKDAKKLYDILMSRYLVQGNNTKTGAKPTVRLYKTAKASQMLYCALATMQTEYNYHDNLPKPSAQVFDQLTDETTQSENPKLEESDIIGVAALILIVVLVVLLLAIGLLGCYLLRKCNRRKAEDANKKKLETDQGKKRNMPSKQKETTKMKTKPKTASKGTVSVTSSCSPSPNVAPKIHVKPKMVSPQLERTQELEHSIASNKGEKEMIKEVNFDDTVFDASSLSFRKYSHSED